MTIGERLDAVITDAQIGCAGPRFKVQADWTYTRVTTGNAYTCTVSEINQNQHVLSQYNITAPDIVHLYQGDPWVVEAAFFDENGKQLHGGDLFVQCILVAPHGEYFNIVLQDDGISPDTSPDDGTYTGKLTFGVCEDRSRGILAVLRDRSGYQHRAADMDQEEAAQIIGGLVRTHYLRSTSMAALARWSPTGICQCDLVPAPAEIVRT